MPCRTFRVDHVIPAVLRERSGGVVTLPRVMPSPGEGDVKRLKAGLMAYSVSRAARRPVQRAGAIRPPGRLARSTVNTVAGCPEGRPGQRSLRQGSAERGLDETQTTRRGAPGRGLIQQAHVSSAPSRAPSHKKEDQLGEQGTGPPDATTALVSVSRRSC
jgi:hypothetical protein